MEYPAPLPDAFRRLGDPSRFRILRALARGPLNGSELVRVLGLAQSSVSRHLRLLAEGGLVAEERRGGWTLWSLPPDAPEGLGPLWEGLRAQLGQAPDPHGDDARLAVVLREREERRVGWGGAGSRRPAEPGRSWSAWARALGHLLPPLRVVDLGCGEGALTLEIARWAGAAVGVDPDEGALQRARRAARRVTGRRPTFRRGPLDRVPLPDRSHDLALLSQVLHRETDPGRVVSEAARVVRPGGRVLVLDLLPHEEGWVRSRLGHRALGFEPRRVAGWLEAAGLVDVRTEDAARRRGNPFTVLVASGVRSREDGR